jgi:uncharacterized membrane protein
MTSYPLLKLLHIASATMLFGTGLGTAFHMWQAHRSGDLRAIAAAARATVLADWLFTTPAVILQPLTGIALLHLSGRDWAEPWVIAALTLYLVAGLCWLPVVWLQVRMRELATAALHGGTDLPSRYHRYFALWFALGWPAFIAVAATFYLMVYKPPLW